jgi:N-acetylmuramoyl-L-alanine amidase
LQTHFHIWKSFQRHNVASLVMKIGIVVVLTLLTITVTLSSSTKGAQASGGCARGDRTYVVARGDTLGRIAAHYRTSASTLARHNHISNPNLIHPNKVICVPGGRSLGRSTSTTRLSAYSATLFMKRATVGNGNPFPYPACTWWADQRYYQMHGTYVPWRTNAMAWQWTARAYQFGWHVSTRPSAGSIVNMQPWVQGAYGAGHVAVVERVLSNGSVIASSMSWGANPYAVVDIQVHPGSGITFIRQ